MGLAMWLPEILESFSACVCNRSLWRSRATWYRNLWFVLIAFVFALSCFLINNRALYQNERRHEIKERSVVEPQRADFLPLCPPVPPNLKGLLEVKENVTLQEAEERIQGVTQGGQWSPPHCQSRWRVAIVVPYRDRSWQLGTFMNHMHGFLQRQELNYSIYIIEQEGEDLFNRARLLNVGYLEAQKEGPWDCVAFHDVDMLPEDDRHLYHCSHQPRHLVVGSSNHRYKLPYFRYFGGACLMTKEQVELVNGWSNIFWGWGGEDDDMWRRIDFTDMKVWRYKSVLARYKTIVHDPQELNNQRFKQLERNTGRYPYDGLSNLKYEVRTTTRERLYTHILAYIGSSKEISVPKKEAKQDAQELVEETSVQE